MAQVFWFSSAQNIPVLYYGTHFSLGLYHKSFILKLNQTIFNKCFKYTDYQMRMLFVF